MTEEYSVCKGFKNIDKKKAVSKGQEQNVAIAVKINQLYSLSRVVRVMQMKGIQCHFYPHQFGKFKKT